MKYVMDIMTIIHWHHYCCYHQYVDSISYGYAQLHLHTQYMKLVNSPVSVGFLNQ